MKKILIVFTGVATVLTIGVNAASAGMNPFWAGVLQELGAQTVRLFIRGFSDSGNYGSNSNFTQSDAVNVVKVWLRAKHEIFSSPYNTSLINDLSTGEQKARNFRSLNWLVDNNGYFIYDNQWIEGVEMFATSETGVVAKVQVIVHEDKTLYVNERVDNQWTTYGNRRELYTLRKQDGVWRIEDIEIVD